MRSQGLWLIPTALAGLVALAGACGAPDPSAVDPLPGHGSSRTGPDLDSGAPDTAMDVGGQDSAMDTSTTESGGGSGDAGGESGSTDTGGASDGPTTVDSPAEALFKTAYASNPPMTSAASYHSMKGGPGNPNYKMACLSCHNGKTTGTVEFLFAGSIYGDPDAGTPAADIEVRVNDAKGKGVSAFSDTDGNYWATSAAALATPGLAGARNAVSEQIMPQTVASGDCNSCHNGTAQPTLHVP